MLVKYFCSLVMMIVCINPVIMVASELPVPSLYGVSKDNSSRRYSKFKNVALLPSYMLMGGFKRAVNVFPMNIDFSPVITILNDNKRMLGIAVGAMGILLIAHRVQKSEKWKSWFNEKYIKISTIVEDKTNNFIKNSSFSVQFTIMCLKSLVKNLSNLIAKCIGMNETTIISSVASPVVGSLLDYVCVCPIPLLSFTSIGWVASAGIILKEYVGSSIEKNIVEKIGSSEKNIIDRIDLRVDSSEKSIIANVDLRVGSSEKSILNRIDSSEKNIIANVDARVSLSEKNIMDRIESSEKNNNKRLVEIKRLIPSEQQLEKLIERAVSKSINSLVNQYGIKLFLPEKMISGGNIFNGKSENYDLQRQLFQRTKNKFTKEPIYFIGNSKNKKKKDDENCTITIQTIESKLQINTNSLQKKLLNVD